eukprot:10819710-Karenia_brevis.AAC.1
MHTWRDICFTCFKKAVALFGPTIAISWFKALPTRPVSGRWGILFACLCEMLNPGEHIFKTTLLAVLDPKKTEDLALTEGKEAKEFMELAEFDDPRDEASLDHRLRMGKWRLAAANFIRSNHSWQLISDTHVAMKPLCHHLRFIQKSVPTEDLHLLGSQFCQLVCGKADAIFDEFTSTARDITAATDAAHATTWGTRLLDKFEAEAASEHIVFALTLLLHNACEYHRRFVLLVR